jgi:hypothetical protein
LIPSQHTISKEQQSDEELEHHSEKVRGKRWAQNIENIHSINDSSGSEGELELKENKDGEKHKV